MKDAVSSKGNIDGIFVDVFKKYSAKMKAAFDEKKPQNSKEKSWYNLYQEFEIRNSEENSKYI